MAAGLADAAIAVVTMAFSHAVGGGLTGMVGSWATYALMLGGPCSLLLTQTAYQAGRPMITLPVIAVVTPVASLAVGNLLLGESARLGVLSGTVVALAVLVTSAGLVVLARLATGGGSHRGGRRIREYRGSGRWGHDGASLQRVKPERRRHAATPGSPGRRLHPAGRGLEFRTRNLAAVPVRRRDP